MSCGEKTSKFKLLYNKKEGCYRAENIQKDLYSGCSLNRKKRKTQGLFDFTFRILMTSRESKEFENSLPAPPAPGPRVMLMVRGVGCTPSLSLACLNIFAFQHVTVPMSII